MAVEFRCADTLYSQKLALTSLTCSGSSVSIVRLRTKATEFFSLEDLNPMCELWYRHWNKCIP
jgi:hypothetical protein